MQVGRPQIVVVIAMVVITPPIASVIMVAICVTVMIGPAINQGNAGVLQSTN